MTSPTAASGLLLSRDLIFIAKIVGTARELGCVMKTAGNLAQARAFIESEPPAAVFVDLAAGDVASPESIGALKLLLPDVPFLAFGSHVDTATLAAASRAGCDPVLPRSRFAATLPDLIRQYLGTA